MSATIVSDHRHLLDRWLLDNEHWLQARARLMAGFDVYDYHSAAAVEKCRLESQVGTPATAYNRSLGKLASPS
jgi:hypothetical protein